jgi:hypothetical protein
MKKLLAGLALVISIFAFTAGSALATTYWFKFPAGVQSFTDRNGTVYTPDVNSLTTITDLTLFKNFVEGGMTPLNTGVVVLAKDVVSHAATGATTTVDGTTYSVPPGLLQSGRALRITVYGTAAGGNAAGGVNLYLGGSAISSPRWASGAVGPFKAEFIVQEYTDYAHQQVNASLTAGTVAGATTSVVADNQTGQVNMNNGTTATTLKTQVYSNNSGDTTTQTSCVIEILP